MSKIGWMLVLALMTISCKRVQLKVDSGDEVVRMTVPYFVVDKAIRFTSENGDFEIEDLAGVNETINLGLVLQALKEDGDHFNVEIKDGDTLIKGWKQGHQFRLTLDELDGGSNIRINLPLGVLDAFETLENGQQRFHQGTFLKALKRHSGVFLEVKDHHEHVQIIFK